MNWAQRRELLHRLHRECARSRPIALCYLCLGMHSQNRRHFRLRWLRSRWPHSLLHLKLRSRAPTWLQLDLCRSPHHALRRLREVHARHRHHHHLATRSELLRVGPCACHFTCQWGLPLHLSRLRQPSGNGNGNLLAQSHTSNRVMAWQNFPARRSRSWPSNASLSGPQRPSRLRSSGAWTQRMSSDSSCQWPTRITT